MSRECLVDGCGKSALAAQPLCIKHGVLTPQGLVKELRNALNEQFKVKLRVRKGETVSPGEIVTVAMAVARMQRAVRAYWNIETLIAAAEQARAEAGAAE